MRRDIAELMLGLKADTPDMVPDGDARDGAGLQVYRHTFPQISFRGRGHGLQCSRVDPGQQHDPQSDRTPILGSRAQFAADPRQRIPSLTLGMDVLHQLHLTIVYGQQKLYVTSAERTVAADASERRAPGRRTPLTVKSSRRKRRAHRL